MSDKQKHNLKWWLKTIGEGALWAGAYYSTELLQIFPDHTFLGQDNVAIPLGFAVGFVLRKFLGARSEYQKNPEQLPGGIEKSLDKMSNKITGIKGSKKNG